MMAPRFAVNEDIIGHDIGGLAGTAAVGAAEAAYVGRSRLAIALDLAEPALALDFRQGQRLRRWWRICLSPDERRYGCFAGDLDLPALGSDGANCYLVGTGAIDIERFHRIAQVSRIDIAMPQRPLSSRTVNSKVSGPCGKLFSSKVAAIVTKVATPVRLSPPKAVFPAGLMRRP